MDLSRWQTTLIIIQMNTFQITSCIDQIYPDIEGELCSKHTTLLNQLQRTFRKAYSSFEPTHYVIAKGIATLAKSQQHSISMALEQGITILLSAAEEGEQLYIEGNVLDEELILQSSGKFISPQSNYPLSKVISSIIKLATEDINPGRMRGGVLYIHSHDKLDIFGMKDSMLIGIFMSICLINGMIEQYSEDELIRKLEESKMLSKSFCVESYFKGYANRSLLACLQQPIFIEMDKKYKLLFMSLHQFSSAQPIFKSNHNENSNLSLLFHQFSTQQIDLLQFFTALEANQSNTIQNQQLIDFISQIRNSLKIKASIIVEGDFCVFLVQSYRYAELIGRISKKIHQHIAQKINSIDNGELHNPFTSKSKVTNQLFSSAPSKSLDILDPTSCLWF